MSTEVCENIVRLCEERIPEKSAFTVTWYGGEPLLAPHIIEKLSKEFIRICDAKNSKYFAGIITNGYLLTKENLDFLIDSKVTFAQVTVDGPEEIHDKRRCLKSGGRTYQRIVENLANIKQEAPLHIGLRINIDRRNSDSISQLLDDLRIKGFHNNKKMAINFGQITHNTNAYANISSHCMASAEFADFMVSSFSMALDRGFIIWMYPQNLIAGCSATSPNSLLIEPNGTVQVCWEAVGDDRCAVGIVKSGSFKPSTNYSKWLGWSAFRAECRNCRVLPICMGGCPFKSIYPNKISRVEENICVWWKHNLEPMLQLIRNANEKKLLFLKRSGG
jgi:uncharacterized protein